MPSLLQIYSNLICVGTVNKIVVHVQVFYSTEYRGYSYSQVRRKAHKPVCNDLSERPPPPPQNVM